jgi:hypothetical protein
LRRPAATFAIKDVEMSANLKWAHRYRLDLALEIAQLESGLRKVTQIIAGVPVDVTEQVLLLQKDRFAQLEEMVFASDSKTLAD